MPREVYAETGQYRIEYDPTVDAIVHTWKEFVTGQEFRDGCNELLAFVRERDTNKQIVDSSGIKAHDDADKRWLEAEWIPEIIDAGIDYAVSVTSDSAIAEMELEEFVDQTADLPFTYVLAGDIDDAREWIDQQ